MHLIIDQYGMFLGKKSECLVVRKRDEVLQEVPIHDLEQVTIASRGVSLSADAIEACVEAGVEINLLTTWGKPLAKIVSPTLLGTVATRRAQLAAYDDGRALVVIAEFVSGKLRNQANLLRYFGKYRKGTSLFDRLSDAAESIRELPDQVAATLGAVSIGPGAVEDVRATVMALEAQAAKHYWEAVADLLDGKVEIPGRQHRGADDPFNAALNYGYGVLYNECWRALELAGLEPFAGFLHADRSGKPSLVLDFVEEFRAPAVDRAVIARFSRNGEMPMEEGGLPQAARREIATAVGERFGAMEPYAGGRQRLQAVIHLQARRLACFLRGEGDYHAFASTW